MKIKQEFETLTTHGNLFKILDFRQMKTIHFRVYP